MKQDELSAGVMYPQVGAEGGIESADVAGNSDRAEWLFERLRDEILSGVMKPDQKLSEPQIARRYNTSRAPLREALRLLEERQLVTRSPRTGARVAVFSAGDIEDLIMMRERLEGLAAARAAVKMTDAEIEALRTLVLNRCEELRQHPSRPYYLERNRDFHTEIAKSSGSAELQRLLCKDYFFRFRLMFQQRAWSSAIGLQGQNEHLRIVEAIAARDSELAEMLMRRHVRGALGRYLRAAHMGE